MLICVLTLNKKTNIQFYLFQLCTVPKICHQKEHLYYLFYISM
uniref:Uncharacterized protein n=1 Tax=Myoviridae sp. ctHMa1 TaxID=2827671 RepID=A0A8S5SFN1_9CAUD|nr:MAG TPA: hypothetical protein [Myoviridae sp. ctHMa1]